MRKRHAIGSLMLLLSISGCKKDELVLDDLTTNPFDFDYTGQSVFEQVATRTVTYTSGAEELLKLEIDVRVNTALFPVATSYGVRYRLPSGLTSDVIAADLTDNVFTMTEFDVTVGTNYCFVPRLTNNGASGSGATICATAE